MKAPQTYSGRAWVTLLVYLGLVLLLMVMFAARGRHSFFQPWTRRFDISAACSGETILAYGGRDQEGSFFSNAVLIDHAGLRITAGNWVKDARVGSAVVPAPGGGFFVLGGYDGDTLFSDIMLVDPKEKSVSAAGALPYPAAFGAAAPLPGSDGGRMLYAGGWDGAGLLAGILSVDPESGQSETLAYLPEAREFLSAVSLGEYVYLLGGTGKNGRRSTVSWRLDPRTGAIGRLPPSPVEIGRVSAAVLDGSVHLFVADTADRHPRLLTYDPERESWSEQVLELPTAHPRQLVLTASERELFLVGGTHPEFQRQLGFYRVDTGRGRGEPVRLVSRLFSAK